jgi:translation initiation factor IF-2
MSDDKKLTLAPRAPLGIKKTEVVGKVRQSFSHGRSNTVVVETKKRKLIGKEAEAAPVQDVAPPPPPPPAPKAAPRSTTPPARTTAPARGGQRYDEGGGFDDRASRQEALQAALKRAEEERRISAEEARKREDEEKRLAVEAEAKARDANKRLEDAAPAADAETADEKRKPEASPAKAGAPRARTAVEEEEDERRARSGAAKGPVKGPVKPAPARSPRTGDERRQSGKLSVSRALNDDETVRMRSLAAIKRAREKDKRGHMMSGPSAKQARDVVVPEVISVQELANRMAERAADVVKLLFKMGMPVTVNENLDQDTAELVVTEFGHVIKRVADSDVELGLSGNDDDAGDLQPRPPIVTIMGHVDHGKTSLLDAFRNSNVVSGEAGGITQHIGAYQITLKSGEKITFLDTPGHEAFTQMRARGANVTDIVIVVVAADDGLMPQTLEAINHTKAAGVPMIVAINKMDKPGANPAKVREALLQHDVQVEAFGGEVQDVEISALKKTGLEELTEKILLQAEVLEFKANPKRPAEGRVVEAELDKGRGPVATVLVRRGTLRVGDIFVVGAEWGKVRALINDRGQQIKEAGPSQPVEVLGLSGVPGAGDEFSVVESEARAREVASYRAQLSQKKRTTATPVSMENIFSNLKANRAKEFALVVKADVQGSVEAVTQAVNKISTDEIKARVLHAGVGSVTESDVTLAAASNAPIICFNVRPNANARAAAEREGVAIKYYNIIYNLVDDVKAAMAGELGPETIDTVIATVEVRDVFQAGKSGKAAGCMVSTGAIKRSSKVRLLRDDVVIYTGSLTSLRRFKDDVNEVRAGLECGMTLDNYQDMKKGDVIEAFELEQRERTL